MAAALIVLRVEVDENPATRNHVWVLPDMILVSIAIAFAYRSITGQKNIWSERQLTATRKRRSTLSI